MGRDNYRRAGLGYVWKDEFNFFVDKQALCLCLIMIFRFELFLFFGLIKLNKMPSNFQKFYLVTGLAWLLRFGFAVLNFDKF